MYARTCTHVYVYYGMLPHFATFSRERMSTANVYTYTLSIYNTVYIISIRHCKHLLVVVYKCLSCTSATTPSVLTPADWKLSIFAGASARTSHIYKALIHMARIEHNRSRAGFLENVTHSREQVSSEPTSAGTGVSCGPASQPRSQRASQAVGFRQSGRVRRSWNAPRINTRQLDIHNY